MDDKASSEQHPAAPSVVSQRLMGTLDIRSADLLRELAEVLPRELGSITNTSTLHRMIGDLNTALVAVRTRCNLISTAYKLPPEILLFILDLVRRESAPEDGQATVQFSTASIRSLVASTHVCHQWRTVALHSPTLWTGLVSSSPLADTFAHRAQEFPLSMTTAVVGGQLPKPEKRLLWRLRPRIQRLDIVLDSLPQLRVFLKPLAALSSTLEEMTIVVRKKRTLPAFFNTPFPLFGGSVPRLKSLSISSPDPLFPTDSFPNLLSLHLSDFTHGHTIRGLAQILRNAGSLEVVHMHPRYPGGTADSVLGVFSAGAPIHLPRMRRFCLTSLPGRLPWYRQGPREPSLYTLLSQLVFHSSAVVTVRQAALYAMARRVPRLYLPSVGRSPTSVLTADERGTTVTTRGHSTYSITYQERLTACAIWGLHEVPPRRVPFRDSEALLRTVTVLLLQGTSTWRWPRPQGNSVLSTLVAHTPFLTELVVRELTTEMLPHLTHLLTYIVGERVLCPLLNSLTFITLRSTVTLPGAQEPESILSVVLRAAVRRAEHGFPLTRLTFCSPYVEQAENYTLQNSHGILQVSVLCRDVWFESSAEGVDRTAAAHWEAVEQKVPREESARTRGFYETMWQKHVEGTAPTGRRTFGAYGHKHKWP